MIAPLNGQQLAGEIRQRAAQLGVSISAFVRPLSENGAGWLDQLARAEQPRPHTIARIRDLLNGAAAAAPSRKQAKAPRRHAPVVSPLRTPAESALPGPIDRDPCIGCGVRADRHAQFGCRRFLRGRKP